jgi:hypothetical protein
MYYGPGVNSASKRKEYQGYLPEGNSSQCARLATLPLSSADCPKILEASISWSPKCLSRPDGIALPFLLLVGGETERERTSSSTRLKCLCPDLTRRLLQCEAETLLLYTTPFSRTHHHWVSKSSVQYIQDCMYQTS